jgi:di/tricarboxylate transporter
MTQDQAVIFFILSVTVALFMWGRWRHDVIAMGALLACVLTGLTPAPDAFTGFGHPAVVTVACVLVLSRGLQDTGAVDALARRVLPEAAGPTLTIAALTGMAGILSGFVNNVGALALLMPVALRIAARHDLPPGRVLMPMAFGSIFGGMTTLIGTPPNLIVAGFRAENGGDGFGMFDFTPVGVAVAGTGIAFTALLGWRLVPVREHGGLKGFETGAYLTEVRVPEKAKVCGMTLREIEAALDEAGAQVIGLVRREVRIPAPSPSRKVRADDILIIVADPDGIASALSSLGVTLEVDKREELSGGEAG